MRIQILFRHVYFEEFSRRVAAALTSEGVEVSLGDCFEGAGWDVRLCVGVHLFPDVCSPGSCLLAGIQTEQLGDHRGCTPRLLRNRTRFQTVERYFDLLFDWIPGLAQRDRRIFLPYGCEQTQFQRCEQPYDVCFIGNIHHGRREPILKSLLPDFRFFPDFSPGFGAPKQQAIQSSRILLNLRFYEDGGFESPRMFDYLAAGAFVISEQTQFSDPFAPGRDFVEFQGLAQLRELLHHYLADDNARLQIAASGHRVSQQHTWSAVATRMLQILRLQREKPVRSDLQRWLGWGSSRLKCISFSSRDQISLLRRRLFRG